MISLAPINPLSGNKMSFAYYNEIDPHAANPPRPRCLDVR